MSPSDDWPSGPGTKMFPNGVPSDPNPVGNVTKRKRDKKGHYAPENPLAIEARTAYRLLGQRAVDLTFEAAQALMYEEGRKFGQAEGYRYGYERGRAGARAGIAKRLTEAQAQGYAQATHELTEKIECDRARDAGEEHYCKWCPNPIEDDDD